MGKIFVDKSMEPYIEEGAKCDISTNANYSWVISPSHVCVYRTLFSGELISIPCVNKITITNTEIILTQKIDGTVISINRVDADRIVMGMDRHIVTIAMEPGIQSDEKSWPRIYESLISSPECGMFVRLNKDDYLRFLTNKTTYRQNREKIRRKIKSTPIHVNDYLANARHVYIINDIQKDMFVMTDLIRKKPITMSIMDVFMSDLKVFDKRAFFILKDRCIRCHTDYDYRDPSTHLDINYDKYLKEMKRISKLESIKDLDLYRDFHRCERDIVLIDKEKNRVYTLYCNQFQK